MSTPREEPELDVVLTARLVTQRKVHVVTDESVQSIAQALLDLYEAVGRPAAEGVLAGCELRRKAKAPR